jgi:hypothetical protein
MNSPPIPCFAKISLGAFQTEECWPTYICCLTTSNGLRTNEVATLPHAAASMCLSAGGKSIPVDSIANFATLYVVQKVAAHGKLETIALVSPAYILENDNLELGPPC